MKKLLLSLFIVFVVAFFAGKALLVPGFPPTHDGEYHIIRFYEFDKVLRDGTIYPRWAPDLNNGFGVPLFNFVYPLPNYMASFFHFLGFSFIDSFKLSLFSGIVLGGIFCFLWTRIFWGNRGGILSAIFYLYSPYYFLDVYIRGSVGEVWALGLFPGFLWAITSYIYNKRHQYGLLSIIFLSLVIFSHNILGLLFFVFAILYIVFLLLIRKEKKKILFRCLYVLVFSLLITAIFWLPALAEKQYVTGLQIYNVKENFPELYQLLIPSWGSDFSGDTIAGQMSFQIGIANLLIIGLTVLLVPLWLKRKTYFLLVMFFLLNIFFVFYLMLRDSAFVWDVFPLMNYFQFPWRLLSIEILLCAFLAGSIVFILRFTVIGVFLAIVSILLSIGYANPAYYHDRTDHYYTTRSNFIDGTNSPGNLFNTIWFDKEKKKSGDGFVLTNSTETIKSIVISSTVYKIHLVAAKDVQLLVNTAYFPGWEAQIDGHHVRVERSYDGLIRIPVPSGEHFVQVSFTDTMIRSIASLLTMVTCVVLLFVSKRLFSI